MSDDTNDSAKNNPGFLGSLRDALKAASREEDGRILAAGDDPATRMANSSAASEGVQTMSSQSNNDAPSNQPPPPPSAAEAARKARGGTPNIPPVNPAAGAAKTPGGAEAGPPTTRVVRETPETAAEPRTQLIRGRQSVERGAFNQDPVVGWLVIVGGPGLGAYRPVFEGNNTIGRTAGNRIPIDFGDDAISSEEQAYIRYDSGDRSFLLVPNMSKTNIVSVNEKRPTSAITLQSMDVITMGRTQLVFVPFCGPEFDWGELGNIKS